MDVKKIVEFTKRHRIIFGVLFTLLSFLTYRHFSYIYSLSPMVRDFYVHMDEMEKNNSWSYNADDIAKKYFELGMSSEKAKQILLSSGVELSKRTYRSPDEIKKYDVSVGGYKNLRAGYGGIYGFIGSYQLVIVLNFNNNRLEAFGAGITVNSF